jgi:uncharacterized membrane protein (DUF106 family)
MGAETQKKNERMLSFDQQFEFQVAMILAGIVPHSGTSIDFIIKMLMRQGYDSNRLEEMKMLAPLLQEEMEYLKLKEQMQHLEESRQDRLEKINRFIYGEGHA